MPLPENAEAKRAETNRIARNIILMVSGIAVRCGDLPSRADVFTHDDTTNENFLSHVQVAYVGDQGSVDVFVLSITRIHPEGNAKNYAEYLIDQKRDIPLILDDTTALALKAEGIVWQEEEHRSIVGLTFTNDGGETRSGTVTVYTPYKTHDHPEQLLSSHIDGGVRIFDE